VSPLVTLSFGLASSRLSAHRRPDDHGLS